MDSFDRLVLAVMAGLALAIGVVVALGDQVGAPVVDLSPKPDSAPPVTAHIAITFGQVMQPGTVEPRFSIKPPVSGQFSWEGARLVFTPDAPLTPGTTYMVSLEGRAESSAGRVSKPVSWSFRPRLPGVLYFGPADEVTRSLWAIDIDGDSPPRELIHTDYGLVDFAPSPDGSLIVMTVLNEAGSSDIWLANGDGSGMRRLIDCAPGGCSGAVWSPDGGQLAYERQEAAPGGGLGPSRVWLVDMASENSAPVYANDQVLGFTPAWSPDGSRLAFFDGREGVIRVLNVINGQGVLIPSVMGEVGVFSPDGTEMIYVDIRPVGGQFFTELYLASFEGKQGYSALLEEAEEDHWPAWSPDGRWVAFGRRRLDRQGGFGGQFMLLDRQSGAIRQVTDDPRYNCLGFKWDPTGRYVLFTRFDLEATPARPEVWLYDTGSPEAEPVRLVENAMGGQWLP